jgi:hypothetical protein
MRRQLPRLRRRVGVVLDLGPRRQGAHDTGTLVSTESLPTPLLTLLVALPAPVLGGDHPQELRLHASQVRARSAEAGAATSTTVSRRTPPGVWTRTCSPGLHPSSALPTGEPVETHSGGASATTLTTIVYSCSPSVSPHPDPRAQHDDVPRHGGGGRRLAHVWHLDPPCLTFVACGVSPPAKRSGRACGHSPVVMPSTSARPAHRRRATTRSRSTRSRSAT